MQNLPDEILLHIISYLEAAELVNLQTISRQFLRLSRDNALWKSLCFSHSLPEQRRRRHETPLEAHTDPRLAELVRAADSISASFLSRAGEATKQDGIDFSAEIREEREKRNEGRRRRALLANWDPSYPEEKVNWWREFVERHARVRLEWFEEGQTGDTARDEEEEEARIEATGAGIMFDDDGIADKLVAPMEDGSVSVWEASPFKSSGYGRFIARTDIGLLTDRSSELDHNTRLTQSKTMMTETGAVECVSIDSAQRKGFFAVQNVLNEVDLHTLQVKSRTPYPFPITALSEARHPNPLTVGTNWTLHLHDSRVPHPSPLSTSTPTISGAMTTELISGPATPTSLSLLQTPTLNSHVSLSQPGALSILHMPSTRSWDGNGDIWVAGRFTSFLNFDRRYFPKLRGTVHSGARLSCLTRIPHPFISHSLRSNHPFTHPGMLNEAKEVDGSTLVACGEYKGKGSLELYGLSSEPGRGINSSDTRTTRHDSVCYQNRQTASSSKLLSVAPHGTRIVFADGDGGLKWVERDGSTGVRALNINTLDAESGNVAGRHHRGRSSVLAGIGSSSAAHEEGMGDIVQKIMPVVPPTDTPFSPPSSISPTPNNLLLWTGEGRLGTLSLGSRISAQDREVFHDAVESMDGVMEMEERRREAARERERIRAREYGAEIRRALEMQARELRWLRGYGLGG